MILIQNAIRTPDGTILVSRHVHDCNIHVDKNGESYMIDGGLEYIRSSINVEGAEDLSLLDTMPIDNIASAIIWGTRPNPKEDKIVYKFLQDLETDHLKAIAKTQKPSIWILMSIFYILDERKQLW